MVSSSCIACLAHLAVLYEDVGRVDPSAKAEVVEFCDSALQRLGTLSSALQCDEYTSLDLLLGMRVALPHLMEVVAYMRFNRMPGAKHCLFSIPV
jgi:hypothetical protein